MLTSLWHKIQWLPCSSCWACLNRIPKHLHFSITGIRNAAALRRAGQVPQYLQSQWLAPYLHAHFSSLSCPNSELSDSKVAAALLLFVLVCFFVCLFSEILFLSSGGLWVLLKTSKVSEWAEGGALISCWLVQRIYSASVSKMSIGNNAPLHGGRRKDECLLFFYTYANLEKSAGEMSAVKTAVVAPNVFRCFTFCFCCRWRELLLFLISNPPLTTYS